MLGSFTEELVNRTIDGYGEQNIAFFKKAHIPLSIGEFISLIDKADIDYYGVYKGRYIGFEVKETSKDYFLLSRIKPHQKEILMRIPEYGAITFLLLNFASFENSVFIVFSEKLKDIYEAKKSRIFLKDIENIGVRISVSYPGILDGIIVLESVIK